LTGLIWAGRPANGQSVASRKTKLLLFPVNGQKAPVKAHSPVRLKLYIISGSSMTLRYIIISFPEKIQIKNWAGLKTITIWPAGCLV
jgi:hypothetical protein